ncbi:3-oxoacid CoA-transferase subunit A [Noviherbaspirillum sp. Root189]|uniref:3-oxoacid CoA-transferase subunit A n=1 Tax=Noviherbaspirillum sp. Root189 TaxID=1736487 RepID=UPI0007102C33|nr:3-oxoacid CoA-transferase subunit A [Noviherbaspirillum sp. Root189]KRB67938.1 3-oxoadipate CoA-transferase [Noviherbaspirillum sp. Root189]
MLNKVVPSLADAVANIKDGSTLLVGGFGPSGVPTELLQALLDAGARELTVVNNNAGNGETGLSELIRAGRVRKMICSFARSSNPQKPNAEAFREWYRAGKIELEVVPQGTLAERLRAAGAGVGPFFTPTSYGTLLAKGKESREFNGRGYVLEHPLHGDVAFVCAQRADAHGNLMYRYASRNFGPVMCMASKMTVAQVDEVAPVGELPPEHIATPGIFVQRVVEVHRNAA